MGALGHSESEGTLLVTHQPPLPRLSDQVEAVVPGAGLDLVFVQQSGNNLDKDLYQDMMDSKAYTQKQVWVELVCKQQSSKRFASVRTRLTEATSFYLL